jgi:outer membrane protein assembly factor BamB
VFRAALALATVLAVAGCGQAHGRPDWPLANADLAGTRAAAGGKIDAGNVSRLRVRWRFAIPGLEGFSGLDAATPVVSRDRVFLQDLNSNVYALSRSDGRLLWKHRYAWPVGGPNGLALSGGRVYGSTINGAFALDARTGRELWRVRLTGLRNPVSIAPLVDDGLVFTSTTGTAPGGRGKLYALDASNGRIRWRFDTILGPWAFPREAFGGGAWNTPSLDPQGRLYVGTANPNPWGGTRRRPNGGSYAGPALYTDSLLALRSRTGRLLWHDQVTPHDIRDHDFQATPMLVRAGGRDLVIGAGKHGVVIAWERRTGTRIWKASVGLHRNDSGPLPARRVTVCPGLLGGVETPMAASDGRVFVPVVDLCTRGSATGFESLDRLDPTAGRGELVALDAATGRRVWTRRLPQPVFGCATVSRDVVFTATFDGRVYAMAARDGAPLWTARTRAGINACPAVAGDLLLVGAGSPYPGLKHPVYELVAYGLG